MNRYLQALLALLASSAVGAPALAQIGSQKAPIKFNRPLAPARFRLILTGFSCLHETADDLLEFDGKGDEIYFAIDVSERNAQNTVTARRQLRSLIYGDVNRPNATGWVQAGSRSDKGGIRTGDNFPALNPWTASGPPQTDRLPMTLWEGTLASGGGGAVVVPTVWEWDSRPESYNHFLQNNLTQGIPLDGEGLTGASLKLLSREVSGDRPVGVRESRVAIITLSQSLYLHAIRLNRTSAEALATRTSPNGMGRFTVEYTGQEESYRLYFHLEKLP